MFAERMEVGLESRTDVTVRMKSCLIHGFSLCPVLHARVCLKNVFLAVKSCSVLSPPRYGRMSCSKSGFSFETVCQFSCFSGFRLVGSRSRTCLAIGYWSGMDARCKGTHVLYNIQAAFHIPGFFFKQKSAVMRFLSWKMGE